MPSTTSWRSCRPSRRILPEAPASERSAPGGSEAREDLARRLGWAVDAEALLLQALRHRSWCAENPGWESNERLEFLGDSVLGLIVTDHLFRTYPDIPEGELTKVRASVVNSAALAEVATGLDVGRSVMLGKGEDQSGGREKPSILADATEALIGAIYIDRGWSAARHTVLSLFGPRIEEAAAGPGGQDYKTRLQELCARLFDQLPRYSVRDEGPDHAKSFEATVYLQGTARGSGWGRSKKQAEQAAARVAWESLAVPAAGTDPVALEPTAPEPTVPGATVPDATVPGAAATGMAVAPPDRDRAGPAPAGPAL